MKVIEPGHIYIVDSVDGVYPQKIVFVKREGERYPGNVGAHAGTQMQELLRVVADRARYVNNQIPCFETDAAIQLVEIAILLMEARAKRVKGKSLTGLTVQQAIGWKICTTCGHVNCTEFH